VLIATAVIGRSNYLFTLFDIQLKIALKQSYLTNLSISYLSHKVGHIIDSVIDNDPARTWVGVIRNFFQRENPGFRWNYRRSLTRQGLHVLW